MQLGLSIELRPNDQPGRLTDQVAEMGYNALHVHFPAGCDTKLARRLARACAENGLAIAAVSGYANPLRPDDAPMGSTFDQLADLIDLLPVLDARRIISWSGSYAAGLFDAHPDNHNDDARKVLHERIDELFALLEASEAILLLAPHYQHVLGNPATIATFFAELNSPYLRIVLDLPSLLPPAAWPQQAELIPETVALLAPYSGLLQLQDLRLHDGQPELCSPGQGQIDYPRLLRAVRNAELSIPAIVSQTSLKQAAGVRRFVLDNWRG
jgi:sugar phosphate isomerase/epimerase